MIDVASRLILVVGGLLLLLTYLLLRAATPDTAVHERRLGALNALILNQAALHRDLLRARAGLLHNYDPLVSEIAGLRQATNELEVTTERLSDIGQRLQGVRAQVSEQETLVDRFKSNNALLQNSMAYFAHLSHRLGAAAKDDPAVATAVGSLTNAMLRFTGGRSNQSATELARSLDQLAGAPTNGAPQEDVRALNDHGQLILATLPALDETLARLFAARTADQAQDIQALLVDEFQDAERRATIFRGLLYLASVLLLAYLAYLYLRLRANARALAERSGALQARSEFERLIAGLSTQFIDLPRDGIGAAISRALDRLGRHLGVDRAYVILSDTGSAALQGACVWRSAGTPAFGRDLDLVAAVASNWTLEGYNRLGCIETPSVTGLPPSSEKSALQALGVRSWLCVPLWHGGRRVGLMAFDVVQDEKRWLDDDITLLRMTGEIFANAVAREQAQAAKEAIEMRLRQAQRMEAIGTLAGGIAHNFNNMLSAILGNAEMALAKLTKGSRTWENLQEVRKAGERARSVVDQILIFSRRVEHRHQPVRMQSLLDEAVGLLRVSLPTSVALEVSVKEDATVMGDPSQLQQVVINLCTNAAQAMAAQGTVTVILGGIETTGEQSLSHGTLPPGRYARLAVTDSGPGMDPATMDRIFEPFFTTKAVGTGTGLGLATVHGIVGEHGGALHVTSRPGAGSTFEAYFPQTEVEAPEDERAEAPLPIGHGETVLLVDDEKSLVLLSEEMLAALGYEPVGFESTMQALEAFRANPQRFDLLLADEVMPGMSGTQLAAAVHQIRPDLPIILMTGYGGLVQSHQLQAAGIRDVLRKPLASADIAERLARHLSEGARAVTA